MVEIDPGLDTRLRAFFDHYESEPMPPRLATFDEEAKPKGRSAVPFLAGALGVAVIAAAAAVFAMELSSHNNPGQSRASQSPAVHSPVGRSGLPILGGSPPLPANATVLVPTTVHTGSATLPTFTPTEPYYIETSCIGTGPFDLESGDGSVSDSEYGCGSGGTGTLFPGTNQLLGQPVSLQVNAPDMTWEILIVESSTPRNSPNFYADPFQAPAGAQVRIPLTSGKGPVTLPVFTPGSSYYIVSSCSGLGGLNILTSSGALDGGWGNCVSLKATGGPPIKHTQGAHEPLRLSLQTAPSTSWKILIYEMSGSS
jgi:hypothetical protein